MSLIECVPNVSEGQSRAIIDRCVKAIAGGGATLLDVSSDPAHHRSVFTFAGDAAAVSSAALALFDAAIAAIDLRTHRGAHPRIGAVDVVPFVPLAGSTMADCVAVARSVAALVAERHRLPVFLYEEAALRPDRRRLEDIRRGGFERLAARLTDPEWAPDFGPSVPHPSAGASVVGARSFLIAFNVTLRSTRLEVARAVAQAIRERSGGLPCLKAMGVALVDRGVVQVSMNLTDFRRTSMIDAFDAVRAEAARHGVEVIASELVGLAPAAALTRAIAEHVRLEGFSDDRVLETRLERRRLESR